MGAASSTRRRMTGAPEATSDTALFGLVQRLADNKYWLGRRYAEWCTSAPTLESAVAAAAMSQDEIGHARSHYPLFRQFVGQDVEPEGRAEFHSLAALDQSFAGWIDFVATNYLVDTALTTLYEAAQDSSFDDLRNRARRIIGEEETHWLHGLGWVRRLASESTETKASLTRSLSRLWPETYMWFGSDDDQDGAELVDRGILRATPQELRDSFAAKVGPPLAAAAIELGESHPLEWERWDRTRYRLAT